ncbi:YkgJ family cysteine cluster protein [Flavihumibacter sp. CACIAM 22H1]|uniref:YkgJ family cysteine cluster protein n=1 Tax=Flavihumibacter sp. CACIAM 22H1 TaxID=1812911 RepID=UPI0007A8FF8E|nr:YkgJ family cysteine cluster protein [Flavihumibacter sp. CACIAM 22H1]KYP13274.1 MAG: hypothetical protein A1D16_09925 [Flavihumibacter sp. CACIAM 22H1]
MNKLTYPIDLGFIAEESERLVAENEQFRSYLRSLDQDLDTTVQALNQRISSAVDCTACGNCCRSLLINVSQEEAVALADRTGLSLAELKQSHLEESLGGQLIINTIPCHFLEQNKCTIYENRFAECREFPHLHKDGFRDRLFGILMHYGRCPIVYYVVEELKGITDFRTNTNLAI